MLSVLSAEYSAEMVAVAFADKLWQDQNKRRRNLLLPLDLLAAFSTIDHGIIFGLVAKAGGLSNVFQ